MRPAASLSAGPQNYTRHAFQAFASLIPSQQTTRLAILGTQVD